MKYFVPLDFETWVYESNIEEKYQIFHDEYGDAACLLVEYKERHYQEYLQSLNNEASNVSTTNDCD
jgi:hypothetical protein